jgi:hypothetical protein
MNSMGYLGMISVPLPHQRREAAAESQVGGTQDLEQPAFPCSTGRHRRVRLPCSVSVGITISDLQESVNEANSCNLHLWYLPQIHKDVIL